MDSSCFPVLRSRITKVVDSTSLSPITNIYGIHSVSASLILLPRDSAKGFGWIQFAFPQVQTIKAITMVGGGNPGVFGFGADAKDSRKLEASDDGVNFKFVSIITPGAIQEQTIAVGLGSRGSLPVQFILQNQDLDKLKDIIPKFLEEARKDKTFSNADVNLKFNRPELQVTVDRMKVKRKIAIPLISLVLMASSLMLIYCNRIIQ